MEQIAQFGRVVGTSIVHQRSGHRIRNIDHLPGQHREQVDAGYPRQPLVLDQRADRIGAVAVVRKQPEDGMAGGHAGPNRLPSLLRRHRQIVDADEYLQQVGQHIVALGEVGRLQISELGGS